MMMQAAGAGGGVLQTLNEGGGRKRIPPWLWGALGVSITLHLAGLMYLYNQHWKAPAAPPDERIIPISIFQPYKPPKTQPVTPPKNTNTIHKTDPLVIPKDPTPINVTKTNIDDKNNTLVKDPGPPNFGDGDGGGKGTGEGTGTTVKPPVILNPTWLSKPDAEIMSRFYPPLAAQAGIEGSATIHCTVTLKGTLSNCSVVSETPQKQGFGAAAKRLAPYFRMKPKTVDGQPVEGAEVTVPIRFSLS